MFTDLVDSYIKTKEQEIRNKAIDEFTEQLKSEYKICEETDAEAYKMVCKRFDKIAEQMKGE